MQDDFSNKPNRTTTESDTDLNEFQTDTVVAQNASFEPVSIDDAHTMPQPTTPTAPSGPVSIVGVPTTTAPISAVSMPSKNTKKKMIMGLSIAGVLVLLSSVGVYAWYQNPQKVLTDALSASSVGSYGLTMTMSPKSGTSGLQDIVLSADSQSGPKQVAMNMALKTSFGGKAFNVKMSSVLDESTGYVRLDGIRKTIETLELNSYMSADANAFIDKVDNKWVKIDASDLEKIDPQAGKAWTCGTELYSKLRNDKTAQQEFNSLYKKQNVYKYEKQLPSKNGMLGYQVTVDQKADSTFFADFVETKTFKSVSACTGFADDIKSVSKSSSTSTAVKAGDYKIELWADQWSHSLKEINMTTASNEIGLKMSMKQISNKPALVTIPKADMTFTELKNELEKMQSAYDLTSPALDTSTDVPTGTI